ncbi:hypothetical protein ACFWJ5_40505 [Streptomyces qaidamensis]|uniref:hypothetical protein n=1 Tax=Streptomyces qaidamensis TaxID=1783515 RepID=UPI00365DFBAB
MAALARTATGRSDVADSAQPASGPVLAVSASASSTTDAQIADAVAHGWAELAVPTQLLNGQDPSLLDDLEKRSAALLTAGRNVIVHTTRGTQETPATPQPVPSTPPMWANSWAPWPGTWPSRASPGTSPYSAATPPATHC